MAKKNQYLSPKSGKCDLLEGILIGEAETKGLIRNKQENTPDMMIRKFNGIVKNSSCNDIKNKAARAIELLSPLSPEIPVRESDRIKILKKIYSIN